MKVLRSLQIPVPEKSCQVSSFETTNPEKVALPAMPAFVKSLLSVFPIFLLLAGSAWFFFYQGKKESLEARSRLFFCFPHSGKYGAIASFPGGDSRKPI